MAEKALYVNVLANPGMQGAIEKEFSEVKPSKAPLVLEILDGGSRIGHVAGW